MNDSEVPDAASVVFLCSGDFVDEADILCSQKYYTRTNFYGGSVA